MRFAGDTGVILSFQKGYLIIFDSNIFVKNLRSTENIKTVLAL